MNPNHKVLVAQFHSLDGHTAPEKWRSLHSFLKSLRTALHTRDDLNHFIGSIVPIDSLGRSFRIQILIEFKLFQPIMDELKNNNHLLIRKLMKAHEVFGEVFSNVDPPTFIKDIFPHLSYVAKLKILHGIYNNVKDEKLVDEYFLAVEGEYGLRLASNLLAGCTANLRKVKMDRFYTNLSNKELILILKRNKDFLSYYLPLFERNEAKKVFGSLRLKVLKKFAQIYPESFWEIKDEHKLHVMFGRRMTPKMFRHRNPHMLKNGYHFVRHFVKYRHLYRIAENSDELRTFFASLFPATHQELAHASFHVPIEFFLKQFPASQHYAVFSETFKEKFGLNILDFPEYCKWYLRIIPVRLRNPVIDNLITQDETLIVFYTLSKSIRLIKKKLRHCADNKYRARLVSWMCKACVINNNRETFVKVLDYIVDRYKNDLPTITEVFNVMMNSPDIFKLDDNCWDEIYDIYQLLERAKPGYFGECFYSRFFAHLIERRRPLEEHCKRRLEQLLMRYHQPLFRVFLLYISPKYERVYLIEIGKCIALYKHHKNYQAICISYLNHLVNFNIYSRRWEPINVKSYSALFDQIKTTDCFASQSVIKYCLQHYPSDEIWHDLFWKQVKVFRNNIDLAKYGRKCPHKVTENLDKVLDDMSLDGVKIFLRQAKRSLDKNSLEKFKDHALNLLNSKKYEDIKLGVTFLSIIAPETLLNLAEALIVNTAAEGCSQREFVRKKLMTKQLHRLGSFNDTLSLILKYCNNGRCIRYALIPLWGIAYRASENYIKEELPKFADGPRSARKTVLILSTILCRSTNFARILQVIAQKENDPSMKNTIFEQILNNLRENPSEFFWNSFKASVSSIDTSNREMYEPLMNIPKIPREFLPEYIPMVYEQMSSNPFWEIQKKRFEFLEVIPNEFIDSLDMSFLKSIIRDTACLEKVSNFHWKSIFFANHVKRNELLETNFKALDDFICENRPDLYRSRKARNTVNNFVLRFVEVLLNQKRDRELIEKFMVLWNTIEATASFYQSYLTVRFTRAYFRSNFEAYKMGVEIKKLLNDYVTEIGLSAISLFSDRLDKFLGTTGITDRNEVSKFVQGLSDGSLDENVYALIVNLVTKNPPQGSDQVEFDGALKAIMKCEVRGSNCEIPSR